jgi:hypothetical protein
MAKRIMITFDERSSDTLNRITEQGKFSSTAATVRNSLDVTSALQQQAAQGFTEVVVRNPKTNQEKIVVIPGLK